MPQMSYTTQVPLSTRVKDIFKDEDFNTARRDCRCRVYARHAVSGAGRVIISVSHTGQVEARDVGMTSGAGAPAKPDDLIAEFGLLPGERIKIDLEEVGGVAITPFVQVFLDEV